MDEEELWIERQIAWLKDASPEEWHRVVLDFNWDNRTDSLFWIVQQPECDKATALTIFWLAQPSYRLIQSADHDGQSEAALHWNMVQFIGERINTKGYTRTKIAFDATPLMLQDYDELIAEGKKAPDFRLKVHPDLKCSIRGQELRLDRDFYQRYPEEFHGSVLIDLPESSIVTPYMKTARSEVATWILNLVAVGCLSAFLAGQGLPKPGNRLPSIVALFAICFCLFSSRSSLQVFKGIVRAEGLQMPLFWIRIATILSLFSGAGLGLAYRLFFMGHVQALIKDYGTVATIIAGLIVILPSLWLVATGFARVLVYRKTFR